MTRAEIEAAVLDWIAVGPEAPADDARFERLALALFAWQYEHGEAFRRICDAFERTPRNVARWQDVPAVPTGAFKEARLAAFPEARTVRTFRSSGTSTAARGALHLDTLRIYEASLLATFRHFVVPDATPLPFFVLAPSAERAPDSSLSYMFSHAARRLGAEGSRFFVEPGDAGGAWHVDGLIDALSAARSPLLVAGTAFAFVHLIDALDAANRKLSLPDGTRVMETGGFKGRSRELTRDELHGAITRTLGVPANRIVNQYGMCELGSQFYDTTLRSGVASPRKRIPAWVRTRAVDPATLRDVPPGEPGALQHFDLANTGSVLAVQTSDLGSVADGLLEVLGRIEGAEARGCSIAADALIGGARS